MTTSLMFVTYNRLPLTQRMMANLLKNTDSPFRLIIIDNGSTDGTVEWLKNLPKDNPLCQSYDVHFNEQNLGIATGRNQGLLIANKYNDEWLSTLDNDIEVPVGWLTECIDIMQKNPKLVMGINMENVAYPLVTRGGKTFQVKPMGNLGTACTIFHRDLHKAIGFFTTEYSLYGEEDADFFFRARLAGWDMGYIKEMGIHFGDGELDTGEYRIFKDSCRAQNLAKFRQNCGAYITKRKSLYIPFQDPANNS